MKTLSLDLRQRILDAYAEGNSSRQQIADRFMVSLGMVKKLIQRQRHTGSIGPKTTRRGPKRKIAGEDEARLRQLITEQSDATLEELRERLTVKCSLVTVHRSVRRLSLTYKKKGSGSRGAGAPGRP